MVKLHCSFILLYFPLDILDIMNTMGIWDVRCVSTDCLLEPVFSSWLPVGFPLGFPWLPWPGRQCGHAEDGPEASNEPRIAFPADCSARWPRRFCNALPGVDMWTLMSQIYGIHMSSYVILCHIYCHISQFKLEILKWTVSGSIVFFGIAEPSEGVPLKRSCLEVPPLLLHGWEMVGEYLQMTAKKMPFKSFRMGKMIGKVSILPGTTSNIERWRKTNFSLAS